MFSPKEDEIVVKCMFIIQLQELRFSVGITCHVLTDNSHSLPNIHCNIQYDISVWLVMYDPPMLTPGNSAEACFSI